MDWTVHVTDAPARNLIYASICSREAHYNASHWPLQYSDDVITSFLISHYKPHPLIEHRHSALRKIDHNEPYSPSAPSLYSNTRYSPTPHTTSHGHPLHPVADTLRLGARNKDKKARTKAAALRPFLAIRQSVSSSPAFRCASADIILYRFTGLMSSRRSMTEEEDRRLSSLRSRWRLRRR